MSGILYDKIYGCLVGGLIGDAMGGPTELKSYKEVEEKFGWVDTFDGAGTDDTVIKTILTDAIFAHEGNVTADEWAEAFVAVGRKHYALYFAPVRNMFHKLEGDLALPVYAGMGNAPSSSSAMAIAPMGIINACDPRRAAGETYDVAGVLHAGETTFCRDGACAIAAAIAEALKPETTVDAIAQASHAYLHRKSSKVLIDLIEESIAKVASGMDYKQYRAWYYENRLRKLMCDSRETLPATIAIFILAQGDMEKAAVYSANFGRDSDTIGTMAAAIAGAYKGASALRPDWLAKMESYYNTAQDVSSSYPGYNNAVIDVADYREIAKRFVDIVRKRDEERAKTSLMIRALA